VIFWVTPAVALRSPKVSVREEPVVAEVTVDTGVAQRQVEVRGLASAVVCPRVSAVPLLAARKPRRDQRVVMTSVSGTLTFKRSMNLAELSVSIVW